MRLIETREQPPALTRAGQQQFWNRQASTYELARLTENEAELALIRSLTGFYIDAGYPVTDLVTLGGAVGSRDPTVLIDECLVYETPPRTVYFNDISPDMVQRAMPELRASYPDISFVPVLGAACEAGYEIPRAPRRVVIGVYSAQAFVEPCPHYGLTMCGFDEYMQDRERLGSHFEISSVFFDSRRDYEARLASVQFSSSASNARIAHVKSFLRDCMQASALQPGSLDALRILAWNDEDDSFFISHWFSEKGIRKLVETAFGTERAKTLSIMPYGKGFLVCIDPLEMPQGIVTMLNNVLGNVLPEEWQGTLKAMADLSQ